MSAAVPDWVAGFLNRRTEVEEQLRLFAQGKRPPISSEEALALANKLGVPDEFMGKKQVISDEMMERAARKLAWCAWEQGSHADNAMSLKLYPGGSQEYVERRWQLYAESANAALEAALQERTL